MSYHDVPPGTAIKIAAGDAQRELTEQVVAVRGSPLVSIPVRTPGDYDTLRVYAGDVLLKTMPLNPPILRPFVGDWIDIRGSDGGPVVWD